MRKYLILIVLLLPCLAYAQGMQPVGGVTVAAAAGDTYTDILFWWRCEGTTLGAGDYSAGDTTAANANTAAINTDAVKVGTNGIDADAAWDGYSFTVSSGDLINTSLGRVGFWLKINTWVNNLVVFNTTGSGGVTARLKITGDDDLSFEWVDGTNDNSTYTTGLGLSTGTWYFIEIAWDATSNYKKIFLDSSELSVSNYNGTGINAFTNTELRVGICSASAGDIYMDNIMISNDPARNFYLLRNETASPR